MLFFLLAAAVLTLLLWYNQALGRAGPPPDHPQAAPPQPSAICTQTVDKLSSAVAALLEVMSHPALGGPGFLTVRFPPQGGVITVTAQYPNIQETLYRRAVRRELDRECLLADGFPKALLDLPLEIETESGGMVLLMAEVPAEDCAMLPLSSLRTRQTALSDLSEQLKERFPDLSVRSVGGELLLSPIRETASIP